MSRNSAQHLQIIQVHLQANHWLIRSLQAPSYAHLSKVPRMVLVHHDSVVVLATSISTTSRMLPVLANTAMTSADMTTLLPVFPETCMAKSAVNAAPCGLCYFRAAIFFLAIAKAAPELIAKEALHPNKCLHPRLQEMPAHSAPFRVHRW